MFSQDIDEIGPGEICAIFGVECATGDTFTDGTTSYSMVRAYQIKLCYALLISNHSQTSMFVPDPVISLAIKPIGNETPNFSRALNRFQKEDPTFRVHIDRESKEVRRVSISNTLKNFNQLHPNNRRSYREWASSTSRSTSSV